MKEESTTKNAENARENKEKHTMNRTPKNTQKATAPKKEKTMKTTKKSTMKTTTQNTHRKEKEKTMSTKKQHQTEQIKDHGTVAHGDKTLVLTQDAYPTSGSFPVPGGATYTGDWYEAHAVDAGGKDYRVIWTDVDYETEDESDACDWDDPDYVLEA